MKKSVKKNQNSFWTIIKILAILFLCSFLLASILKACVGGGSGGKRTGYGNVAVIPLEGIILAENYDTFPGSGGVASATSIMDMLSEAEKDPSIKAIVLKINSPGGSPVATDEIASEVKGMTKPVVAMIREVGASGGYWIASSAEYIVANRMSMTGSIGVIGSYLGFEGIMDDYNITYNRLTAGKYKDMGTPLKALTSEERDIFQNLLDKLHTIFIDEVTVNRNLPRAQVAAIAEGQIFLGADALELGLVDELGGKREVTAYLEKTYNITADYVTYEEETSLLSLLSKLQSENYFHMGRGIATEMFSPKNMNPLNQLII